MEFQLLKCDVCGKIVAVVKGTAAPTICCGKPMQTIEANIGDGAYEKHVPVFEVKDHKVEVKVGSIDHPMITEHYIEFVVLKTNQGNQRKELKPGQLPHVIFALNEGEEVEEVLSYCNLHGLYKSSK